MLRHDADATSAGYRVVAVMELAEHIDYDDVSSAAWIGGRVERNPVYIDGLRLVAS